jgi:hypothetical protein
MVPAEHPLRRFFAHLVRRHLAGGPDLSEYVSGVLAGFARAESLYGIRDARGRRLEDVGEMLLQSNPLLEARSFDRERQVRKHIGDYTLFLCGMFPEYVAALPRRGLRLDSMIDYVQAGKESYRIVASFDLFEYRREAPLFRKLAGGFEMCVYGLNQVKRELEAARQESYRQWRRTLSG